MEDEQKPIKTPTVLGFDQSLTNTGYCVLDNDGNVVDKGLIQPPKMTRDNKKKTDRIIFIQNAMTKLINEYNPSVLAMEEYSFATKGQAFYMGELGGMVKLLFGRDRRLTSFVLPPGMVKKFATGVGNADKNLMLKEVYKRWGQDFDNDNICDAYVIAKLAKAIHNVKNGIKGKDEFTMAQWDTIKTCIKRNVDEF